MPLEQLSIAIMTVDRQPAYVHQTLASLFSSGPGVHNVAAVHLVAGTSKAEYLRHYSHHRRLTIHTLTEEEHASIADWIVHRRFCHNYHRCLSLPIAEGGGICVCEDDIVFRDRFAERLVETIREMEEAGLKDYCLSLASWYDFEANPSFYRGERYCSYGYEFAGTQCMYYPRRVAQDLRDYLFEFGVAQYSKPGDLLIGERYQDRMYATCRGLATHIGDVSTGLGGGGPSPTFHLPYKPLTRLEWGGNR